MLESRVLDLVICSRLTYVLPVDMSNIARRIDSSPTEDMTMCGCEDNKEKSQCYERVEHARAGGSLAKGSWRVE